MRSVVPAVRACNPTDWSNTSVLVPTATLTHRRPSGPLEDDMKENPMSITRPYKLTKTGVVRTGSDEQFDAWIAATRPE